MNTRYVILPTIFLVVLCLGNANNALAQSVTGGGTGNPGGGGPFVINVSARSGPAGIIHLRENAGNIFAEVVSHVPPRPRQRGYCCGSGHAEHRENLRHRRLPHSRRRGQRADG